jgi:hypothetical protein
MRQAVMTRAALVLLLSALPCAASAQETAAVTEAQAASLDEAVTHLHWSAPEGCPLESEVRALARQRLVTDGPLLLVEVSAEVIESTVGFESTLRAGEVLRTFRSPLCLSVARAVALVFATWVIDGPEPEPLEAGPVPTEPATEPAAELTATEPSAAVVATERETAVDAAPANEPQGRALLRFVGQLLVGFDAFALPEVEPTLFLTLGLGYDWFEIDVSPLGLGLVSQGLGPREDTRFVMYGGRLRVGVMFEIGPEWELGGHLLTEVALMAATAPGEADNALFATFGAGLELRFYPVPSFWPDLGISLNIEAPFPLSKSTVALPLAGVSYELDWATFEMGLGAVVRIP